MKINLLCISDGMDQISIEMFKQLSERGIRVCMTSRITDAEPASEYFIQEEIPPLQSKFSLKAIIAIRRLIKKHAIDIIYSASSTALSNALFASLGTQVKNIGYRGTQAKVRKTDPTYYLAILNPRVDFVVCETNDIKTYLSNFLPERKLLVNTKPFDISWVKEACAHPHKMEDIIPQHACKIIYIANTKKRPHKGLSVLLDAMELLSDTNTHLTFIGNYDEEDYHKAQRGKAKDKIHFLGERKDAIYFLPTHDLFVLPSTRDASPRTVREAMACGLPCVVSDIPGTNELIEPEKTGLLATSASPEALAKAIRFFIDNPDQKEAFGIAGRQRIIDHFAVKKYVDTYEQLFYKQLSGNIVM